MTEFEQKVINRLDWINDNVRLLASSALSLNPDPKLAQIGHDDVVIRCSTELIQRLLASEGLCSSPEIEQAILSFLIDQDWDVLEFLELDFQEKQNRQFLELILKNQQQSQTGRHPHE